MTKRITIVLSIIVISVIYVIRFSNNSTMSLSNLQRPMLQGKGNYYLNARIIRNDLVGNISNFHFKIKAKEAGLESPFVTVENNTFPIDKNSIRKGIYIYKEPHYLQNIGLILGDDIWVMFSLLYDLNLHHHPRNDTFLVVPKVYKSFFEKKIIYELYNLISSNPIVFFDQEDNFHQNIIFETLIVGWDGYSYSYNEKDMPQEKVAAFRQRAIDVYNLHDNHDDACAVLIIEKNSAVAEHHFSIINFNDLMSALRKQSSCKIEKVSWAGMSLKDQISKIYDKTIVIGLPGSDILNSIFQPIFSGMIVPDQCNSKGCYGSNEVRLWYSRMPYRLVYSVPSKGSGLTWTDNHAIWTENHFIDSIKYMHKMLLQDIQRPPNPFVNIHVNFFPSNFSDVHVSNGQGQGDKHFFGLKNMHDNYTVYAGGIDGSPQFEESIAKLGANVFAFDCTNTANPAWTLFKFYSWCIGTETSLENTDRPKIADSKFYSLGTIKQKLGHHKINMLKIDIEGFEWDILQNEIIKGRDEDLPDQILFELHTEGADPSWVPPNVVANKTIYAVNLLFWELRKRGYQVANKELNNGDNKCAEFVVLRTFH